MSFNEDIKKHISNPFLWIAAVGIIFSIMRTYNQVESNETHINTVERRLEKKIDILTKHEIKIKELEKEIAILETKIEMLCE